MVIGKPISPNKRARTTDLNKKRPQFRKTFRSIMSQQAEYNNNEQ
jgi:hypothetical protein